MDTRKLKGGRMLTPNQIVKKEVDGTHYYFVDGIFYPGVTTILDIAAPKEYGLLNFFKQNTPEDAKAISERALALGSKMHDAYERLINGLELDLLNEYPTIEEKKHILSFVSWFQAVKPKVIATEMVVASETYRFAGTTDFVCDLGGELWLIDFKTSSGIYYTYELQVAAYKKAYEEMGLGEIKHTAILRTGTRHKSGFEFKEVIRPFQEFKNVYDTYVSMNDGKIPEPPKIDIYPDTIRLENL